MSAARDPLAGLSAVKVALLAANARRSSPEAHALRREPVAITGMACRFPGASSLDEFWQLLADGRDAIGPLPADRWLGGQAAAARAGGFLADVFGFDAPLFHLSGLEAEAVDPQQRLLLEVAWEALETAGRNPQRLRGTPTGVFVGIGSRDWADAKIATGNPAVVDAWFGSGTMPSFAAGRISYALGLHGPSIAIDTACSSALVAVHQAVQSLRSGECDHALAAGVNVILSPGGFLYLAAVGALAADGRCKTFDGSADGFGRAEGCAVVVLRRLVDALRDGDHIFAVIRGSAVNQDGGSSGLTAPNAAAQESVIRAALADAGLPPAAIDVVEAHGTGTLLGDPIELRALQTVFAADRAPERPLLVASVKTNIGHLEAAAGIAGLIKTVLALRNATVPAHLNLGRPNPHVPWEQLPFRVPDRSEPWPTASAPRRAAVSSFGLSGTNAHVVVEEAPQDPRPRPGIERSHHIVTLAARSDAQLRELAGAHAERLRAGTNFADAAFTANVGRAVHSHRLALVAPEANAPAELLRRVAAGENPPSVVRGLVMDAEPPSVAFLFTGQGAAEAGMARELDATSPAFSAALTRCAAILDPILDIPLRRLLFGPPTESGLLTRTRYAQPALAAVEWSLAMLWREWGVVPNAVLGHSVGEYVAACIAGMVEIDDLLPLLAERGKLMDGLPGGAMFAVTAPAAEVAAALADEPRVAIAALNGQAATVISGEEAACEAAAAALMRGGFHAARLAVSHAFHSPMMDPILAPLGELTSGLPWRPPRIPLAANRDGAILGPGTPPDRLDWARHAREPVRFADGLRGLADIGITLFIEVGPRPVLTAIAQQTLPGAEILPSLRPGRADWETILGTLACIYARGVSIDWESFDRPYCRRRIVQPAYPFAKRSYGMTAPSNTPTHRHSSTGAAGNGQLEAVRALVADALKLDPSEVSVDASLLELGADSLALVEVGRRVFERFGVELTARTFYEQATTVRRLAAYLVDADAFTKPAAVPAATIAGSGPGSPASTPPPAVATAPDGIVPAASGFGPSRSDATSGSSVEGLFSRQLQTIEKVVAWQLDALRNGVTEPRSAVSQSTSPPVLHTNGKTAGRTEEPSSATSAPEPSGAASAPSDYGPYRPPRMEQRIEDDPQRSAHLAALIARYTQRTPTSKLLAERARPRLADSRASAGFRPSIKEMLYPIVGTRADGSRIWDVDGNAYIDISMDFGVSLFGHRAPFIEDAIVAALRSGVAMAPRSPHAGEVAELFCRLTAMERVAFCQSGSEAVMTALRLARLATGRKKVALFRNSYHGHTDGVLGRAGVSADRYAATPVTAGIPPAMVADLIILEYGDASALAAIREHADDLAAVLVEPVQSRAVQLQPKAFLHELRAVTRDQGTLLIFDEMISGFRVHPAGAQGSFGIEADLATYGKALGGGIQIAAVAGRNGVVDGIDGGMWRYGDASFPQRPATFFAGTFNGAPLALAAARAVLTELIARGPELQNGINAMTAQLASRLNGWLEEQEVPIRLGVFGSQFRFMFEGNLDLLFYHLIEQGVFVWEGRNCFLSAAHTEQDVDAIVDRVRDAVGSLREGGFIAPLVRRSFVGAGPAGDRASFPLSPAQEQLWLVANLDPIGAATYNEVIACEVAGPLDAGALARALQALVNDHDALRTAISPDGRTQHIVSSAKIGLRRTDHRRLDASVRDVERESWIAALAREAFDLGTPPLLRAGLLQEEETLFVIVLVAHHIICDGWSIGVIEDDLFAHYRHETAAGPRPVAAKAGIREIVAQQLERGGAHQPSLARWWQERLTPLPPRLALPADRVAAPAAPETGMRLTATLDGRLRTRLDDIGRASGATPFTVLLALTSSYLHRICRQADLLVGFGVWGRADARLDRAVGYAAHVVVLRSTHGPGETFNAFLAATRDRVLEALEHQDYPFADLLRSLGLTWTPGRAPLVDVVVNLDRRRDAASSRPGVRALPTPIIGSKFPLAINAIDFGPGSPIQFDVDTDTRLFSPSAADRLVAGFIAWIETAAGDPATLLELDEPIRNADAAVAVRIPAVAPATAAAADPVLEQGLGDIWREALGRLPAGRDEDFFRAGGTSVQALRLILAVRDRCGVGVSVREFFEFPTIARLAGLVAAATPGTAAEGPAGIPRAARDARRLSRDAVVGDPTTEVAL